MAIDFLSPYYTFMPQTQSDNELELRVWSDQTALASLPGRKRLHVTLTTGSFADGIDDGGTGREEGYTAFDLEAVDDGSGQFTRKLDNLQPAAFDGSPLVRGVVALVLEDQKLTLYDPSGQPLRHLTGATVTLARARFVFIPQLTDQPITLRSQIKLLTIKAADHQSRPLAIVYRDGLPPNHPKDISAAPGLNYYWFSRALDYELEFHKLPGWPSDLNLVKVYSNQDGLWTALTAQPPANDAASIKFTTEGHNVFAVTRIPAA